MPTLASFDRDCQLLVEINPSLLRSLLVMVFITVARSDGRVELSLQNASSSLGLSFLNAPGLLHTTAIKSVLVMQPGSLGIVSLKYSNLTLL